MHHELLIVLSLLAAIVLLHAVSARFKLSFPIVLVLAGLAVSFAPGLPEVHLDPDVVFVLFLPPLLYEAAWFTPWREFWKLRGAIALQAFGLVLFTSVTVAAVAHALVPGLPWPVAFLLGGIISPPDAVAATSVLHGLRVPRSAVGVLEGESLINDASSLIVVRFALAALLTGQFSVAAAAQNFVVVSVVGLGVGLLIGQAVYFVHRRLPMTPPVAVGLTLMTPYLMYLAAEQLHASGVLAVVAGGLYLSSRSHRFLSARALVNGYGAWSTLVFLLNGVVFILIGLQLPAVVRALGDTSLGEAIGYGAVISAVAIVVRVVWTFPSAYLPSFLPWRPKPRRFPKWKEVMLVAWAGMRGVVSLASALAIPLVVNDGSPFPQRALVVFITFVVILVTLVLQGLSLPWVVRTLNFTLRDDSERHRHELEDRLTQLAHRHLDERGLAHLKHHFAPSAQEHDHVRAELVIMQKEELLRLRHEGTVSYELTREKEFELDLELARLEGRKREMTH